MFALCLLISIILLIGVFWNLYHSIVHMKACIPTEPPVIMPFETGVHGAPIALRCDDCDAGYRHPGDRAEALQAAISEGWCGYVYPAATLCPNCIAARHALWVDYEYGGPERFTEKEAKRNGNKLDRI